MSAEAVISASDISLAYKVYNKPADLLVEGVFGGVRHDTFWALRNVSLEVREGQRLGIVGPNGAGKSTLLQIIAGNLTPTSGRVKVNGKLSSLLSLVPAWNPEESGVENIKFNLLLQGVPPKRIDDLTEEIIDFSELGAAVYRPTRTLSSGMSARLAFAVATAADPEILIIDEVLGAGDAYFASKATRRMEEFCNRGKALLFVSHSVAAIHQFCDRAIWLESGAVRLEGDVDYVLKQYELDYRKAEDETMRAGNRRDFNRAAASFADVSDLAWMNCRIVPAEGEYFKGTHYVRTLRVDGVVEPPVQLPLTPPNNLDSHAVGVLDLFGSEWGRLYERRNSPTRVLAHAGGRDPGGRFRVRASGGAGRATPFAIDLEWNSEGEDEPLAVEFFDLDSASWARCKPCAARTVDHNFTRQRFEGIFMRPDAFAEREVVQKIEEANLPPVEIGSVTLIASGEATHIVKEREPFEIEVPVQFRTVQRRADVGVKVTRGDGVYTFWQSSGHGGGNLLNVEGKRTVSFRFNPNLFGAGEYFVNVYVADGWDYPANYPYGRVFDRSVSALQFRVIPEFGGLDFGLVNQRVPVDVR